MRHMDKKLIVFLLSFFLVILIWQKFVIDPRMPKPVPKTGQASSSQTSPAPTSSNPSEEKQSNPTEAVAPVSATPTSIVPAKTAVVDTSLYHAEFSSEGGVLTSFQLKKYIDDFGNPLEMVPEYSEMNARPLEFDLEDKKLSGIAAKGRYSLDNEKISLSGKDTASLTMFYTNGGVTFKKYLRFEGDSYLIQSSFEVRQGDSYIPVRVNWAPGIESLRNYKDAAQATPTRALVNTGDDVDFIGPSSKQEFRKIGSTIRWAGAETNYFCSVFIPKTPSDAFMVELKPDGSKLIHNVNVLVVPQKAGPLEATLFVGPKEYQLLKKIGMNLEKSVEYGRFAPVVVPLYFTMNYFYGLTRNYGWAIVLLTILVKILFSPLVQKSFSSMKKMQVMQPELKKIQDKYAGMKNDDPRKMNMNTEIMQMHKRYGVNPMSGCLPMLLQFPVLYAFYRLLAHTIELRKAPFIFWLQDLSRPDPLHITPILMGATMLLQQRMTPSTDPMQKNMMMMMPIMFTFMSFRFASGLVVYWLLSNILAIVHQWYFQTQQKKAEVKAAA